MKTLSTAVVLIAAVILLSSQVAQASMSDDIRDSSAKIKQTSPKIKKQTEFIKECTARVKAGQEPTNIATICDKVIKIWNIEMSKFLVENQANINTISFIYITPQIKEQTALDSSMAVGGTPTDAIVDSSLFVVIFSSMSGILGTCADDMTALRYSSVYPCIAIANGIFDHVNVADRLSQENYNKLLGSDRLTTPPLDLTGGLTS